MGRSKSYQQEALLSQLSQTFIKFGYAGTSLDDLVKATHLLRGSLYAAFGSKLGMFQAALENQLQQQPTDETTYELVLIAMMALTAQNAVIKQLVAHWLQSQNQSTLFEQLGKQLYRHSQVKVGQSHGK